MKVVRCPTRSVVQGNESACMTVRDRQLNLAPGLRHPADGYATPRTGVKVGRGAAAIGPYAGEYPNEAQRGQNHDGRRSQPDRGSSLVAESWRELVVANQVIVCGHRLT